MKQLALGLLLVGSCGVAGWTVYQQSKTTPVSISTGEEPEEITLLNTATGEVTRSEWIMTPATDPQTGKQTIVQGMYCAKCRKWYPAPPQAMSERMPGGPVCSIDQTRLSVDGPFASKPPSGE